MGILSVTKLWDGEKGGINDRLVRDYSLRFRVITDSVNVGAIEVEFASGIPRVYDPYFVTNEFDTGAICTAVHPTRTDEPRVWEVVCEYSSDLSGLRRPLESSVGGGSGTGTPAQMTADPLGQPAEIEFDFVKYRRVLFQDQDGAAILNAAGMPFDPPVEIDDSRPVVTITRNEIGFDASQAVNYQDAVNTDTFWGQAAYVVKCAGIKGSRQYQNGLFYWRNTYRLEFRRDLWHPLQVLNAGTYYKDPLGGRPKPILDPDTGMHIAQPWLLGIDGSPLSGPSASPSYIGVKAFKLLAFAPLNLNFG